MSHSGILAGAGIDKEKVNYRQHEQCSTCAYFYPANSCRKVAGNISPENVCDLWELTYSTSKHRPNKQFFQTMQAYDVDSRGNQYYGEASKGTSRTRPRWSIFQNMMIGTAGAYVTQF